MHKFPNSRSQIALGISSIFVIGFRGGSISLPPFIRLHERTFNPLIPISWRNVEDTRRAFIRVSSPSCGLAVVVL